MYFVKKIIAFGICIAIVCASFVLPSRATFENSDNKESMKAISIASWNKVYASKDELEENSSLIITGTVIGSFTELREDVVFTKHQVRIDEIKKGYESHNSIITVLQTGGTYNEYTTPPLPEMPLMKTGNNYELYLTLSSPSEKYGQYYLISGGYQGIIDIDKNGKYTLSNANTLFNFDNPSRQYAITTNSTPCLPYYWDKGVLSVYIPSNISSSYSSNIYNGICNGVNTWPNNTKSPHIVITNTFSSNNDVTVSVSNYGDTSWDAITKTTYNSSTNACLSSEIKINTYYRSSYYNITGLWQAITCHEMGHTLGLDHNTDQSIQSIMYPYTEQYFNPNGSPKITDPCLSDIQSINTKYNHIISYTNISIFAGHSRICLDCNYSYGTESHTWIQYSSYYKCKMCGIASQFIPLPANNFTNIND